MFESFRFSIFKISYILKAFPNLKKILWKLPARTLIADNFALTFTNAGVFVMVSHTVCPACSRICLTNSKCFNIECE